MLCQSLQDYAKKHEDIGEKRGERRGERRGEKRGERRGKRCGARGMVEVLQELGVDQEHIVKKLMEKLDLKESEARTYFR